MRINNGRHVIWFLGSIVGVVSALSVLVASDSEGPPASVFSGVPEINAPDGFRTELASVPENMAYGLSFAISPDGRKLAYAHHDGVRQKWCVLEIDSHKKLVVRERKLGHNKFAILGFLWSPDSTALFAKWGYVDIGYGQWFKWDPEDESFDDRHGIYSELREMPVSKRPDGMMAAPRLDVSQLPPVWDRAGVKYSNIQEAEKKWGGLRELQATAFPPLRCEATKNVLAWGGEEFVVLSDVGDKIKTAYFIKEDRIVSTVSLAAPPSNGLWFVRSPNKNVLAIGKKVPGKSFAGQGVDSRTKGDGWNAVDVGRIDTLLAMYALHSDIVLNYVAENERMLVLYSPAKVLSGGDG